MNKIHFLYYARFFVDYNAKTANIIMVLYVTIYKIDTKKIINQCFLLLFKPFGTPAFITDLYRAVHDLNVSLNSVGVIPVILLNVREKYCGLSKDSLSEISAKFMPPSMISALAALILTDKAK